MALLRQALNSFTTKAAPERLPVGPRSGLGGSIFSGLQGGDASQYLGQMASSSWVFSVIDRIATSVAAVDWRLVETRGDGTERDVLTHPALDLWNRPSPYMTRGELLEAATQYFELVGEIPIVILRDGSGSPAEVQLVRPTRITPVPSREAFLAGYIYRVGSEVIPLEVADVIFIRRPNPQDEYRGLGVIQSLMVDLLGEKAAATWLRNFFRNDATPGGVIEVENHWDDSTFKRFRDQWAENHQGVANAHRVAILEGSAKWKDVAFTQRDMQFDQLRRLTRDIILGAFGLPMSALGITESVNRANAEAGEVMFSRWIVRPRLARIQGELNEGLLSLFPGAERMRFAFVDPTPADRLQNSTEATAGYTGGYLTLNEARALVGQAAVPDGDDFKAVPTPDLFGLGVKRKLPLRSKIALIQLKASLTKDTVEDNWEERLQGELAGLTAYLEGLGKTYWQRIELTDVMGWSWDWWSKYSDEVTLELSFLFGLGVADEFPDMPEADVQRIAGNYSRERGAMLLKLDGDLSLSAATRERVRELTAETIEQGEGVGSLVKKLQEDVSFSKERATLVARTESAVALGQGQKGAAIAQGKSEKRWITQADNLVRPTHRQNEAAGWIPIADLFPDGEDTVSQPNCRCKVTYRTAEPEEPPVLTEFRCPAGHLMDRNVPLGQKRYCRKCKQKFEAKE